MKQTKDIVDKWLPRLFALSIGLVLLMTVGFPIFIWLLLWWMVV